MPDPTVAAPPAVAPGNTTSEYALSKVVIYLGAAVTILGGILEAVPSSMVERMPYLPVIMMLVGLGTSYFKARGYVAGRTELKVAAAGATIAQNTPQIIDIVQQVLAAVAAGQVAARNAALDSSAAAAGAAAAKAPAATMPANQ